MNKLKNKMSSRQFTSSLNVMFACEHRELPQASRNIMPILSKRMYHLGHSANFLRSKSNVTGNCVGRSMIEMLGVLAIIAVLTVGGIAGYSKAMLMYHSNKQKDLLVELINNAITLKPNLSSIRGNQSINITDIFNAMGAIPNGFIYKNGTIHDLDNNSINITFGIENDRQQDGSTKQVFKYAIRINAIEGIGKLSISMKEYCKNIIQIVQTIPNQVQSVDFSRIDSDSWSGTSGELIFNKSTIGQTSPAQINERCNIAIKENGRGYFRILLNPD